ncbi:MAG: hypothetical protein A2X87_07330 [Deltaproteobacteria bacterium GWC2_42_51]|nr:MAG: hypothetical protein A2056_02425 [Deltaproteobacteria bacterium GWA2_42_85]OGP36086.1 MAG: hypothetical protein A2X87_07330 [Deltaproteobacteria bacterium GWC2_42_51]OGP43687.1 MAG: hypothetical protein A2090_05860 [Deltaproteobacteria bacterium GWD2_42_10]OGQ26076.1 MAG: hypothetical protein A3D29_07175 [Deltaproteobacteria bacterium RIFCSPHIGHO2_02_FULL_42_44]OGQ37661.1 MAG: hypothetical protein A3H47_01240 [Deltaproteobacteria bacterium RIFCSPLOWO2_02_FULL_42_39]OGQ68246.1 MAG: hypo
MPHKFDPANIEVLLGSDRLKELNPTQFLIENGLKKGMRFADIGCGPGFFSIPAAEIVGERGIIYAVDTQDEMLKELLKRRPPKNVKTIKSNENHIPLDSGSADFVLLAFVLHEAEDRPAFLSEVKRLLKTDGSLLLLEWEKITEDKGPPFEERIAKNDTKIVIEKAGFKIQEIANQNPSQYRIKAVK